MALQNCLIVVCEKFALSIEDVRVCVGARARGASTRAAAAGARAAAGVVRERAAQARRSAHRRRRSAAQRPHARIRGRTRGICEDTPSTLTVIITLS